MCFVLFIFIYKNQKLSYNKLTLIVAPTKRDWAQIIDSIRPSEPKIYLKCRYSKRVSASLFWKTEEARWNRETLGQSPKSRPGKNSELYCFCEEGTFFNNY
jgi:hypothetical protein